MKKIWSYLAVGFAFFSAGLVAMYKVIGEKVTINVKKQRIRGDGNTMSIEVPVGGETPNLGIPTKRQAKKQAKIIKQNRKKADKALKRLDKDGSK